MRWAEFPKARGVVDVFTVGKIHKPVDITATSQKQLVAHRPDNAQIAAFDCADFFRRKFKTAFVFFVHRIRTRIGGVEARVEMRAEHRVASIRRVIETPPPVLTLSLYAFALMEVSPTSII